MFHTHVYYKDYGEIENGNLYFAILDLSISTKDCWYKSSILLTICLNYGVR